MSLFTPQMARFLGPKGLMPSERRGTVTSDLSSAVQQAVGGLDWKADAQGCVRSRRSSLRYLAMHLANQRALAIGRVRLGLFLEFCDVLIDHRW